MPKKSISKIREKAREDFKKIESVHCPFFQEEVNFTSEGFNHIRYKDARKERHPNVQEIRYKLLKHSVEVIRNSKTLQEYEEQQLFIEVKKDKGKREKVLKKVHFFGFIAIVQGYKIKVIVRQVGEGKKHFWSIIPNWKTRKSKDHKKSYQNFTGDLLRD